eukprot:TRINITY_DN97514_c0_g1_i1.p1 TRINITY_DN97514_c0_g1~~TRINITY_DN97514_c0_g1_i1.p1  ORF type:complete len:316 (+),score=54.25 TRINITY_DN97514_c0_g1_i1:81-1028(+)
MAAWGSWSLALLAVCVGTFFSANLVRSFDLLNSLSSNTVYSNWQLQAITTGFCLSPIPSMLLSKERAEDPAGGYTIEEHGQLDEEEYAVESIYALLYSMYMNAPNLISEHGVRYQFTFNTWGFAPSPYPETDPQRHGKAAYAALVTQPPIMEYIKNIPAGQRLRIAEVGCGTGAGANLITREVHPTCEYLALDMQHAAIETCNKLHATSENPRLMCKQIPGGVGINGGKIPLHNNTMDVVVISETHIAEQEIGELEKSIFAEIHRVLKPGGFFVWGNAIPTTTWHEGEAYLTGAGFEQVHSKNYTKGAEIGRAHV